MTEQTARMTLRRVLATACFLAILALGAWMRVDAALNTVVDRPFRNDAKDYVSYSYNWSHYGVYSRQTSWLSNQPPQHIVADALRQPGYPAYLRLFLAEAPDLPFVNRVMLSQACIGIALMVLVFFLARYLLGTAAALGVMLGVAISPHLIVTENFLLSETLYAFLVAVVVAMALITCRSVERLPKVSAALATGALFGLSCLVRPTLEHALLLLLLGVIALPQLRAYRMQLAYVTIAFVLVMAPWWIRNLHAIGHLSDPTLLINTLHHGSYPGFMYEGDPQSLAHPYHFDPRTPEVEASLSSVLAEIARKFAAHPGTYLWWYLAGKVAFFFDWDILDGFADVFTYPESASPYYSDPLFVLTHDAMFYLHWPLVIAGLLGAALAWTRLGAVLSETRLIGVRLVSGVLVYALLVHMIGAPYPRYSIPFRPLQFILAAYAIVVAVYWLQRWRRGKAIAR
jgi:4-amino-4-deoxy-L-arabinose transferase-like glycosyltransferase